MKKHLIILVLFLIVPNLSFAKQLSKSPFIPDMFKMNLINYLPNIRASFVVLKTIKLEKALLTKI